MEKHGFARISEFDCLKITDVRAEFVLKSNESTRLCYPFEFSLKIVFELLGNKLIVYNVIENLSITDMYFSIGAHEGYACPEGIEEYQIIFDDPQTLDSNILDGNILTHNTIRVLNNETVFPLKYEYFVVDALVFKDIKFKKISKPT